jgi:hypothetical protein
MARNPGMAFMAATLSSSREEAAAFMTPLLKAAPDGYSSVEEAEVGPSADAI